MASPAHVLYYIHRTISRLMTMASHQMFSSQHWRLTDQTKFDQTNFLYIINGEVIESIIRRTRNIQAENPYHKH